jgi:hypothetical protein
VKCQAVHLILAAALLGSPAATADPAREIAEIRRLLQARGETIDARTLAVLKNGRAADLAVLRRQIQARPAPASPNVGQGRGPAAKKPAPVRKLQRSGKLNSTRRL